MGDRSSVLKIFIAVLAYDSKIDVGCCTALLNNIRFLEHLGNEVTLHVECGCCYLPVARNNCVGTFLDSSDDIIIFVDSDLWFDNTAIFKLLRYPKPVVCGAYPYKVKREEFPIWPTKTEKGQIMREKSTGLIQLDGGPTGLMAIERGVFEKMKTAHPEWRTTSKTAAGSDLYVFFDTGLLRNDGKWWGEDYEFCNRCRDLDIEMWCEPDIDFHHFGKSASQNNFARHLGIKVDEGYTHN